MKKQQHIVIIGGGLVGLAAARALSSLPVKLTIIEAKQPSFQEVEQLDRRSIALTVGSKTIFDNLGLWDALASDACRIDQVHVSERGGFGFTRVSREAEGLEALGYIVPFSHLHEVLFNAVKSKVQWFCPAEVTVLSQTDKQVSLGMRYGGKSKPESDTLTADMVIAADGVNSSVVKLLGLDVHKTDYRQVAVVGNLQLKRSHRHVAYERFTEHGPLAILPRPGNYVGFTWVVSPGEAAELVAMPAEAFVQKIQDTFGYRLGRFLNVGQRAQFPLCLQTVKQPVQGRVLVLGNAAHNLHPVAGQGFNLSLRDVAKLAECLANEITPDALVQFEQWQQQDQQSTIRITDSMVKAFAGQTPGLKTLRNLGLRFFERQSLARKLLNEQLMGLKGKKASLERRR